MTSNKARQTETDRFPIVGIGASAGGLEAVEGFFANMTDVPDMAFVIVQHMDPSHKSLMAELMAKYTDLPVDEITDGEAAAPGRVYLKPSDRDVVFQDGRFFLMAPSRSSDPCLPIDILFRSLAEDRGGRAIGIVLSGTGSDGTLGLKAIKGAGGMTMAQAEQQAGYAGMPHSAIAAGAADFVLPVEAMPERLKTLVRHPYIDRPEPVEDAEGDFEAALQKIFYTLRSKIGQDFSGYKESTIRRRVERRMAVQRIERPDKYVRFLRESPEEAKRLARDLLIGVTAFFRDFDAFLTLKEKVLPGLLGNRSPNEPLRIWVPGCATGEEAYSLAMLFMECMERMSRHWDLQIFASDLDPDAVEFARIAVYPESIAADVSPERLDRFFIREGGVYKLKKQVRETVIFAVQNLVTDPPFSRLDLVSCRNLLIYLKPGLQKKVLHLFHYVLSEGGVLFLGTSETVGEYTELFETVDLKARIFRRKNFVPEKFLDFPAAPYSGDRGRTPVHEAGQAYRNIDLRGVVEKIVLEDYAPPCVIVDELGQARYFFGRTDRFLQTPSGEPSHDILSMARRGLKGKLRAAMRGAVRDRKMVRSDGVRVRRNGSYRIVDLLARPLPSPPFSNGSVLVVFYDRTVAEKAKAEKSGKDAEPLVESLELELQSTRETLQTTIEELETSNEELKSTNEELQSVNEELQSSNEELKTSREELQSTNEELATVNTELQRKVDELQQANNDINNLLAGTDIGTIFLDTDLRIKRFTPSVMSIFNLIEGDVGRPISDITSNIAFEGLQKEAGAVLDTLIPKELEVRSTDGRWFMMRIIPYRTVENVIEGVVTTFVDITEQKQSQAEATAAIEARRRFARSIVDAVREPMLVLDADMTIRSANEAFYRSYGVDPAETENRNLRELGGGWTDPGLIERLDAAVSENRTFDDYALDLEPPGAGRRKVRVNGRRIDPGPDGERLVLLSLEAVGR